jgi:hypothetical protein
VTTAAGGEQQISTTVLNEKDGWLHLGAYGFTFSSPILRVKLSGVPKNIVQNQSSDNKKVASPTTKQYNLTCVKGKVVKKIIAAKPTCPFGYKKR